MIGSESSNPYLKPRVLFEFAQRWVNAQTGFDFLRQQLKLSAGKMSLSIPKKSILSKELDCQLRLEPIEFTTKLAVDIDSYSELRPCLFNLSANRLYF